MKQTAVEWLVEKLSKYNEEMVYLYTQEIRQAKEIENERLKEAYSMGRLGKSIKEFNETFKQQEQ
jgi:hypothetical protein